MGIPPHLLREREVSQQPAGHVREHIDGGLAALPDPIGQIRAFRRLEPLERGDVDAVLLRKPDGRRSRFTIRLERGGDRRPADHLFEIGLALGQLGHARRQPPRGAVALRRRLRREPSPLETRVEMPGKLRRQSREPPRRELLASDLNQQLTIHRSQAPSGAAVDDAAYAPAMPTASCRTRRM